MTGHVCTSICGLVLLIPFFLMRKTCIVAITVVAVKRALDQTAALAPHPITATQLEPKQLQQGDGWHLPLKSRKHRRRLRAPAHIPATEQQVGDKDGVGDEAGEPEDHGDGLDGQDGVRVCGAREEARGQGQEGHDEERGPDGGED